MRKMTKSNNGKGTLRGFVGLMVVILTVAFLVCKATPTFAFEFNTDSIQEIADKAGDRWEDLKENLKDKTSEIVDSIPAVGDFVQVDNSIGDKNYSFSLIDNLVTDIELKIGDDMSELEAEVKQLQEQVELQNQMIAAQRSRIEALEDAMTGDRVAFCMGFVAFVISIAILMDLIRKRADKFKQELMKSIAAPQPKHEAGVILDKKSPPPDDFSDR